MESKVPEAQADKEPGAENQNQKPSTQWKDILVSTKQDLTPGYLPNIVVTIVAALFTPVLGVAMNSPKTIIIGVALALTFVVWGAAYALIRRIPETPKTEKAEQGQPAPTPALPAVDARELIRPLSVAVEYQFGHGYRKKKNLNWNWVTYRGDKGMVACPVSVALNIRLMNLRQVPSTIVALRVEAKNRKDQWVKLSLITVHHPANELYYVVGPNGLKDAAQMDMRTRSFDYLITKPLLPHEPVSGWAFFAAPENVKVEAGDVVRIYLKDAAGAEMTEIVMLGRDMEDDFRGSDTFSYAGNTKVDISGYEVRYWNE